jgi:hypothetical protein
VNVRVAASVVAWEDRVELQNAILVAELDAAEHGVVDVANIGRVAVATSHYTAIDTGTVAVPCF